MKLTLLAFAGLFCVFTLFVQSTKAEVSDVQQPTPKLSRERRFLQEPFPSHQYGGVIPNGYENSFNYMTDSGFFRNHKKYPTRQRPNNYFQQKWFPEFQSSPAPQFVPSQYQPPLNYQPPSQYQPSSYYQPPLNYQPSSYYKPSPYYKPSSHYKPFYRPKSYNSNKFCGNKHQIPSELIFSASYQPLSIPKNFNSQGNFGNGGQYPPKQQLPPTTFQPLHNSYNPQGQYLNENKPPFEYTTDKTTNKEDEKEIVKKISPTTFQGRSEDEIDYYHMI